MTGSIVADLRESGAHPIHLTNAGLVLLNPFLPRFFGRIDVLSAEGVALKEGTASKAVHLLQWLVDGRLDRPAADLILNKRLCALDPAAVIEPHIEASPDDIVVCEQLLAAVLNAWPSVRTISVQALRENFLQREGALEHEGSGWTLTVRRKTIDLFVDQIPWSFAGLHHRWMREPLHVRW